MNNTVALLDKGRALCSPPTDYRLAKILGIKPSTISRCRLHGGTLDNEAAWKLGKLIGMPPADVVAYMEEDRARDEKKRAFWTAQLPRLLPSIAIAAALLGAGEGTLIDGSKEVWRGDACATLVRHAIHYAHYVLRRISRMATALRASAYGPATA